MAGAEVTADDAVEVEVVEEDVVDDDDDDDASRPHASSMRPIDPAACLLGPLPACLPIRA